MRRTKEAALRFAAAVAVCAVALATQAAPIDDRLLEAATSWYVWNNVDYSTLQSTINQGYRINDLDVTTVGTETRFTASLVQNAGVYAENWWWYFGATPTSLSSTIAANNARLTNLRPYTLSDGSITWAATMVDNTGDNAEAWWWYVGLTANQIVDFTTQNQARLVDLQSYVENGVTKYSAIMVDNSGADARPWWWFYNVTPTFINTFVATNDVRLYSLNRSADNPALYDVIFTPHDGVPWYWYVNADAPSLFNFAVANNLRFIDVEQVPQGDGFVYDAVLLGEASAAPTIPEPATLALLGIGFAVLAAPNLRRPRAAGASRSN